MHLPAIIAILSMVLLGASAVAQSADTSKPMLDAMPGADGKPKVCERVWNSSIGCGATEKAEQTGKLTAGFGGATKDHRDRRDGFRTLRELPGAQ